MSRRGFVAGAALLAGVAALWAFAGSAWIFPQLSANSDEGVYLLQAETLASGELQPQAPAHDPEAFLPWFSVVEDGEYVLKYTPLHAAVLAVGDVVVGTPRASLAIVAAAGVALLVACARELGAGRVAALVAGALFLLSPVVLQVSLTFLPYGTSLLFLLATMTAAHRAVRTSGRLPAMIAGLCWGAMAFGRPYDAVLAAVAICLGLAVANRHDLLTPLRLVPWTILGAAGPVLLLLAFNWTATGDAFELPFNMIEPLDRPGFGPRRALPTNFPIEYNLQRAVSALGRNLLLVVAWTGGGAITTGLALWTLWRRRLVGWTVLASILIVWPLGYGYFWGSYLTAFVWDGALFLGPYYYLPLVASLAVAGGVGLVDLWAWRRAAGAVALGGALLLSVVVAVPALNSQLDRAPQRVAVVEAIEEEVETPAIVFIPELAGPYLQNPFSFLRNGPTVGGDIIYARDRGESLNATVRGIHPDRNAYLLGLPFGWSDQPGVDTAVVIVEVEPG